MPLRLLIAISVIVAIATPATRAVDLEAIGYNDLVARVGDPNLLPDGTGLSVMHIEATSGTSETAYLPDPIRFPNIPPAGFIDASGFGTISSHATGVGLAIYADSSDDGMVPNIQTVASYEAGRWLGSDLLRALSGLEPRSINRTVANASWIANFQSAEINGVFYTAEEIGTDVLRRLDYAVGRDDKVVVAGVANNASQPMADALGNAYNIITTTRTSGGRQGPTTLDVPGRAKPDLAAPGATTSITTGVVSGAALFMQGLSQGDTDGSHAYSTKALLMAGATKTEFDLTQGTPDPLDDWSRTTTRPVDLTYGAGELNIDNSHRIYTAGQQEASSSSDAGLVGWDHNTAFNFLGSSQYFVDVPSNALVTDMSIMLVWNREVERVLSSPALGWDVTVTNLDLSLHEATGFTVGPLIDQSVSTIDNVEHIWGRGFMGKRMAIDVSIDPNTFMQDYTLAWRVDTVVPLIGDVDLDGGVGVTDLAILASNWGAIGADWFWGDLSGDGIVDVTDVGILGANWGNISATSGLGGDPQSFDLAVAQYDLPGYNGDGISGSSTIPAPIGSSGLALLGGLSLRRRRRRA